MELIFSYDDGQTLLDEEEKEGLRIPSVITRNDLNEFEQQNIEKAILWTLRQKIKKEKLLSEQFIKELHRRMYGDVWSWAGVLRKTAKNIGVESHAIALDLRTLLDDGLFWIMHNSFNQDEMALRFKHRLVTIHCFCNGNGRHSRLMADIIIEQVFSMPVFSWGSNDAASGADTRKRYLQAMRAADLGDYAPLLLFARS